jgi:hypothetical protein
MPLPLSKTAVHSLKTVRPEDGDEDERDSGEAAAIEAAVGKAPRGSAAHRQDADDDPEARPRDKIQAPPQSLLFQTLPPFHSTFLHPLFSAL